MNKMVKHPNLGLFLTLIYLLLLVQTFSKHNLIRPQRRQIQQLPARCQVRPISVIETLRPERDSGSVSH